MPSFLNNHHPAEAAFRASDSPLLVVDTDLVIRDVNPAYLSATMRSYDELVGMPIFEAFPDNPDNTQADGVANLSASFERVFRNDGRDYMSLQRYDIPVIDTPGAFARKFWTPVNSPLGDAEGRLIGALHHVEDVTVVVDSIRDALPSLSASVNPDHDAWTSLVTALAHEAHGHQRASKTVAQLRHALSSRVLIEQAKGMIAAREGVSTDHAFTRLRQHARQNNARIHDIARAVVEDGLEV